VKCPETGKVRTEKLDFLSKNPFYTKRFAFYVGRRCEEASVKSVAEELMLDWKTTKELEKVYLQEKLDRRGDISPNVIGIDEIAIGSGHNYWIIVSDLEKRIPLYFFGPGRKEEDLDKFYATLSGEKKKGVRLVVMDMWKAYEKSTKKNVPEAAILYDKFHIISHLGKALDEIRKSEYQKASEQHRTFIKGQKYTLLSHKENLTNNGRASLKKLLSINKRLNTAYILKESFGQLWEYKSEAWARKFFENWKASLKWQRLKPYEDFCGLIERHWEGIASFCKPENKVPLGFVEGFNNKIRTIFKRAYGLRDVEYMKLKILTSTLPKIDYNSPT
jgi:Transposase and inactivated derivatives